MANKETVLECLVTEELQRLESKLDYWGKPIKVPQEQGWKSTGALTIEKFLEQNPLPGAPVDRTLWGIAWECVWGMETPQAIREERENLLVRSRVGLPTTDLEKLWLKLIAVDTDMF